MSRMMRARRDRYTRRLVNRCSASVARGTLRAQEKLAWMTEWELT